MNLQTIEMNRPAAIKASQDYQRAVRQRHSAEDQQLLAGYRALARGQRVVDLPAALRDAGTVAALASGGRVFRAPRLAVVSATAKLCWLGSDNDRFWFSGETDRRWVEDQPRIRQGVTSKYTVFSRDQLAVSAHIRARAIVPIIPPGLRPANLGAYHILWEATWEATAPVDPALVKHIGGNLWAVVAVWDLTPLEQAVVMGRAR